MPPLNQNLPTSIRAWRKANGLGAMPAALAAGLAINTWRAYERGQWIDSAEVTWKIARLMGLPMVDVYQLGQKAAKQRRATQGLKANA